MVYIREARPESVLSVEEDGQDALKRFTQTNDFNTRLANAEGKLVFDGGRAPEAFNPKSSRPG